MKRLLVFAVLIAGCAAPKQPLSCHQLDTARYFSVIGPSETIIVGHKGQYAIYGLPSPFRYEAPIKWCDHASVYGWQSDISVYLIDGMPYYPVRWR